MATGGSSPFSAAASESRRPSAPPPPAPTRPTTASHNVSSNETDQAKPGKPGFGLPFFRILGGGMHNFLRLEKSCHFNDKLTARFGASFEMRHRQFYPRAELEYNISDKFGSLLLTESKAVYRKDFYPKMKAVSMRVRVQTGMYITGKPLYPKIDVDEPKPLKLFVGAALIALALGTPLGASKILSVYDTEDGHRKKEKPTAGLGLKLEAKIQERALCLSVHQLNGELSF